MAVLLHNLWTRPPTLNDLAIVTKLLNACESVEDGVSEYTEERLYAEWRQSGFDLKYDAWVIITSKGQFVGYASVCAGEDGQISMMIQVHPEYRNRGIGTLLLRLAEHRARSLTHRVPASLRVALNCTIGNLNSGAQALLEREGYMAVRHFWRMRIDMDESSDASSQRSPASLTFDMVVKDQSLTGIVQHSKRTGIYLARQYDIYEKELRAGEEPCLDEMILQPVSM